MAQTKILSIKWKYSFDTSAFIDSWRRVYPRDIFVQLWNIIDEMLSEQIIVSTSIVKDEIDYQEDELTEFLNHYPENFIVPDQRTQKYVSEIMNDSDFEGWRKGTDNQADPFVVAFAKTNNLIVVSYENVRKAKNHIPAACRKMGVEHYTFLEFLRAENIVF